jgi:hypothetical protein
MKFLITLMEQNSLLVIIRQHYYTKKHIIIMRTIMTIALYTNTNIPITIGEKRCLDWMMFSITTIT